MAEQLMVCDQCGQARPVNDPCPWHEGPGACVTAPMQVGGRPAGPVRLEPAPHTLGEARAFARLAEKHAAQRDEAQQAAVAKLHAALADCRRERGEALAERDRANDAAAAAGRAVEQVARERDEARAALARSRPPAYDDASAREWLGIVVREAWTAWAREQPAPKPSWLTPWEQLTEPEREADRRIGEAVQGTVLQEIGTLARERDTARRQVEDEQEAHDATVWDRDALAASLARCRERARAAVARLRRERDESLASRVSLRNRARAVVARLREERDEARAALDAVQYRADHLGGELGLVRRELDEALAALRRLREAVGNAASRSRNAAPLVESVSAADALLAQRKGE